MASPDLPREVAGLVWLKEARAFIVHQFVGRNDPPPEARPLLDRFARLLDVSTTVAAIVLAIIVAQVATQAYALVDLARREAVRGGRKWLWALVIALGNLPGAIGYLVAGRPTPEVDVSAAGSGASGARGEAARRAVDALYKPRN
jgi:hypothetical protein